MSQKRLHLWMADQRSLCDRHSRGEGVIVVLNESDLPMCGSCLVAFDELMGRVRALLAGGREIRPEHPEDAVAELRSSRWAGWIELDDLQEEVKNPMYWYPFTAPKMNEEI